MTQISAIPVARRMCAFRGARPYFSRNREESFMEDVVIAGGEQVIRVSVADDVLTLTAVPWWQQRLTRDEALRLAEAIIRVAG